MQRKTQRPDSSFNRNSIGIEIDEEYCRMTMNRLKAEKRSSFSKAKIEFSRADDNRGNLVVGEEMAGYGVRRGRKKASNRLRDVVSYVA